MKKALLIILFILIIVALGAGGYYLRGRQETPPAPEQGTNTLPPAETAGNQSTTAQLPETQQPAANQQIGSIGGSKLSLISQNQALDYFVDKGSNTFLLQPDGQITRMAGNKAESVSGTPLASIASASFSADGKRIAAYTADSLSGSKIHIFDIEKKIWSLFPNAAREFSWAPDSHKIAYLSPSGGTNIVYTADADNSKAKPVEITRIRGEDITVSWPLAQTIFLGDKPSRTWNSSLWALNIPKKTLSPVLIDQPGLETSWNSSATQSTGIAFSSNTNGSGGKLQLINQDGKRLQTFDFVTFPSKCAFYDKPLPADSIKQSSAATSTQTKTATSTPKFSLMLVCAIPREGEILNNSPLPDAYLKKALFTSDDFFEINVSTGEFRSVFSDYSKNLDAENVKIFNQSIFFINRYDKKVYSVALPK